MRRTIAIGVVCMAMLGCGQANDPSTAGAPKSGETDAQAKVATSTNPASAANLDPAAKAVFEFLDAVRTGSDAKATAMLSTVAREKAAELNRSVRPPASDTAKFQVGTVQYIGNDGARVNTLWTDLDENGESQTDEAIWVVRKETEGWRVAGVAATVFDGDPPLLLNFEDPEEMVKKQQWVKEEIQRRTEAAQLQANENQAPGQPVRR